MANKKPIGDMPSMVPDVDDIRVRQPKNDGVAKSNKTSSKSGSSWVTVTLLLVSGVAIAGLALQQYSFSQMLGSYEERLDLANDRIVSLEQSLTQTDESVSMNGTAINAQFKAIKTQTDLQMTEIRKLWDVTNKRNRQWIEDNQALLASQKEALEKLQASIDDIAASQTADKEVLANLQDQLVNSEVVIANLNQEIITLDKALQSANSDINELQALNYEEQFLTLRITQENLLAEQGQISQGQTQNSAQLKEVQTALQSIDVSRQETSRRLSSVLNQLTNLEARFTELSGSAL